MNAINFRKMPIITINKKLVLKKVFQTCGAYISSLKIE
jgi:hypothetical protein